MVSRTTNGEDFRIATDLFWVKNRLDVNYVSNQKQVKKKDTWDRIPITRFDYVAARWRAGTEPSSHLVKVELPDSKSLRGVRNQTKTNARSVAILGTLSGACSHPVLGKNQNRLTPSCPAESDRTENG